MLITSNGQSHVRRRREMKFAQLFSLMKHRTINKYTKHAPIETNIYFHFDWRAIAKRNAKIKRWCRRNGVNAHGSYGCCCFFGHKTLQWNAICWHKCSVDCSIDGSWRLLMHIYIYMYVNVQALFFAFWRCRYCVIECFFTLRSEVARHLYTHIVTACYCHFSIQLYSFFAYIFLLAALSIITL